ncbi:transposase [Glaesserella parasuis ST4-1]|nr:transposase [Glaesserella parasuis ST4-1]
MMNEKQLHALAAEFAKNLKTPEDLNQFSRMLKQITVETALNGELTDLLVMKNISLEKVKMHVTVTHLRPSFVMKVR